jgi:hypothetical protein
MKLSKREEYIMSGSNLIRWAGLSTIVAAVLFVLTIISHPANDADPSAVLTTAWAIAHYLALGYSVLGVLGISGMYARQVEETGWFGLVGFLTFYAGLSFLAVGTFFEAFIAPLLATEAPRFVQAFVALIAGSVSEISLGALDMVVPIGLLLHPVGSLLFGIAVLRAGILPRRAAIVAVTGTVVALVGGALFGEVVGRIGGAVQMLGLAWLGYALWSEKNATTETLDAFVPVPATE